jgi:hypothetical protein
MEFEKYIIEVGVKSFKYLEETPKSYGLANELKYAILFDTESDANSCINGWELPCLKNRQVKVKKLICRLED